MRRCTNHKKKKPVSGFLHGFQLLIITFCKFARSVLLLEICGNVCHWPLVLTPGAQHEVPLCSAAFQSVGHPLLLLLPNDTVTKEGSLPSS